MELQTVRVANPANPGTYMIVNARDYRELVHGPLWHEQEPGFTGIIPLSAPNAVYGAEETRLAAALAFDLMEATREFEGEPAFASLSPHQRQSELRLKREQLQAERAKRLARTQEEAADRWRATEEAHLSRTLLRPEEVPEGVIPGETPGWPKDLATGRALRLGDDERAALASAPPMQTGDDGTKTLGQTDPAPDSPEANRADSDAPANNETPTVDHAGRPDDATQSLDDRPAWMSAGGEQVPPVSDTVEKGPGGKWFVMRDGKPVSEGKRTKAEAESLVGKL
jgi:hypothetical protein